MSSQSVVTLTALVSKCRSAPTYSTWDQTVRFAYIITLSEEGKHTHILCEAKTLPTKEPRQQATKYCRWEIIFVAWTVYAYLSATLPPL
jgi:hypothetical protein